MPENSSNLIHTNLQVFSEDECDNREKKQIYSLKDHRSTEKARKGYTISVRDFIVTVAEILYPVLESTVQEDQERILRKKHENALRVGKLLYTNKFKWSNIRWMWENLRSETNQSPNGECESGNSKGSSVL